MASRKVRIKLGTEIVECDTMKEAQDKLARWEAMQLEVGIKRQKKNERKEKERGVRQAKKAERKAVAQDKVDRLARAFGKGSVAAKKAATRKVEVSKEDKDNYMVQSAETVVAKPSLTLSYGPNVIVDALAGTGKTFTIVEGVKRIMCPMYGSVTELNPVVGSSEQEAIWAQMLNVDGPKFSRPKSCVVLAFTNSVEKELTAKLHGVPNTLVSTCHKFGMSILRSNGYGARVDKYKDNRLMMERYGEDESIFSVFVRKYPGYLNLFERVLDLIKCNLYEGVETMPEPKARAFLLDVITAWQLRVTRDEYVRMLVQDIQHVLLEGVKEENLDVISITDMIWLPTKLRLIKRTPTSSGVDLIVVDERQDLSVAQQQLVLDNGRRIIAVGDTNQAIFGFAGGDYEACKRFEGALQRRKEGMVKFSLTQSRRCSKEVVQLAKTLVPGLRAMPDARDGEVITLASPTRLPGLLGSNEKGSRLKRVDGEYKSEMVLCRTNAPLVGLAIKLIEAEKPAVMAGANVGEDLKEYVKGVCGANGLVTRVDVVISRLQAALSEFMRKMGNRKDKYQVIVNAQDQFDCVLSICKNPDVSTAGDIIKLIDRVFEGAIDVGDERKEDDREKQKDGPKSRTKKQEIDPKVTWEGRCILLSSIHKAKGLEADYVYFLQEDQCPHPMASGDNAIGQELNLRYVAITRSRDKLWMIKKGEREGERS